MIARGTQGVWRRLAAAATLAALVMLMVALPSSAHDPTPQGNKLWSDDEAVTYEWGVSQTLGGNPLPVPDWLRTIMTNVFETQWTDQTSANANNSNGPRFSFSTTNDVIVYFSPTAISACGSSWYGCADATQALRKIWIRSNPSATWCDLLTEPVNDCPAAGRAAIHEVGHIGGFLAHNTNTPSPWWETRMTSPGFPLYPTSTWYKRTLAKCDEASMQLMYDVNWSGGPYGDCFDHITNHGTYGLVTDLTAAPANTTVCSGATVTIGGRLQVHDYGSYGPLGGNGLTNRTVWIDRGSTSGYTSTTAIASAGDNWSKSFTLTTSTTVTYSYVAHYDRPGDNDPPDGLDSSPRRSFSITWVRPTDC